MTLFWWCVQQTAKLEYIELIIGAQRARACSHYWYTVEDAYFSKKRLTTDDGHDIM